MKKLEFCRAVPGSITAPNPGSLLIVKKENKGSQMKCGTPKFFFKFL